MDESKEIPVDRIVWKSPARPLDIKFARRLSKNIRHRGQLQEITVAPLKDGRYEGVLGHHRYEAVKLLGWGSIRCRVKAYSSEDEKYLDQLSENALRLELTAVEKAEAIKRLFDAYEKDMPKDSESAILKAIAASIEEHSGSGSKPPSPKTIHHYLKVAKELPEEVKDRLTGETAKNFGLRHALELLRLKDKPQEQLRLAEKIVESSIQGKSLAVRKLKQEVDRIVKPKGEEPSPPVVSRAITYECPYCGAEYHPYYQGEGNEPHRHGLKRIYRDAEGREIEKPPSLNYRCLDCYSSFPTPVKATFEGVTRRSCPNCGSPNIKRLR